MYQPDFQDQFNKLTVWQELYIARTIFLIYYLCPTVTENGQQQQTHNQQ